METKALKKQLGAAIAMVLVAAIALGAATFAWFVNNNAVTATGVDVSTSSSVPNLYITSTGKTTGDMVKADTSPSKLYPVSTNDAKAFYETLHWASATGTGSHAVADKYQSAIAREDGKTVYIDYTFTLGVANGSMDVYFNSDTAATTLEASDKMGTAGRFAISFDGGTNWKLFKVASADNSTATRYYTDKAVETATQGDYWVTGAGDSDKVVEASYSDLAAYSGSINDKGQAVAGTSKLATISSDNGPVTVTVRVWYEGCDPSCVSENAAAGISNTITGNLGFVGVQPTTTAGGGA